MLKQVNTRGRPLIIRVSEKTIKNIAVKLLTGIMLYFAFIGPLIYLYGGGDMLYPHIFLITPINMLFELNSFAWILFVISNALGWVFVEVRDI